MRLLLDTHVWLWTLLAPERLGTGAQDALSDTDNALLFSAASAWEIAIKYRTGRLRLPDSPDRFVPERLLRDGIGVLPVGIAHALRVADLPDHHRDPFDRLLVAQTQLEQLTLVTADDLVLTYEVATLDARR